MYIDKEQFKTTTSYWGFYKKEKYVNKNFLNFLNKIFYLIFKVKFTRKPANIRTEQESFISKEIKIIRDKRLSKYLSKFFQSAGIKIKTNIIFRHINNFDKIFKDQPISNLKKGMGYNNSLITYIFIKTISPKNVIESGVLRGYTTYLIDKSCSKLTKIFSYDINYSLQEFRSNKAIYFHGDITRDESIDKKKFQLAFFDDHVSHLDRILFSLKKNINNIILDDDVSLLTIHSDGWPPIPTANMIYNYKKIPKEFKWTYKNSLAYAKIYDKRISKIIENYKYFKYPNLFDYTGYKNSSETSILIKKNKY